MTKIEQIKEAIEKAERMESNLSQDAMEVAGFTSLKIRHLLNNLGAISKNYLEIGTHKGSHFISVLFGNKINRAVAIDNYSEFYRDGETKEYFMDKANSLIPIDTKWSLIEQDCFTVKELPEKYFDLYNFDAEHSESAQQRAVTYFPPYLTDEFIMVIDDWQFNGVETGTRMGIKLANLEILFEKIFVTNEGGEHNMAWHNGYGLFYLKQTK